MKLLCLDGNSILNRAFYGIKLLTTKDGRYTNAVYGFMNIFQKLMAEQRPDAVAAAFDLRGPTFRHKMYDGYKATRKGMPEELAGQLPEVQNLLRELGYSVVTCEGYEADDILGTLSAACERDKQQCVIATGDRDSLQLVSESTTVLLTTTHFGRGETVAIDPARIDADYGLAPLSLIEVKALMGDSSDNIPGVAGVGEKTALALIQRFGSLEGVYENIDDPAIKPGVRAKLERDRDTAFLSRRLATICREAPVGLTLGDYIPLPADQKAASVRLASLEMFSFIDRLGLPAASESSPATTKEKTVETALSRLPEGCESAAVMADETGLFAVSGAACQRLEGAQAAEFLAGNIKKQCLSSRAVYRLAESLGVEAAGVDFDLSLAAYLLNPSSSDYELERLAAEYRTEPAFTCPEAPSAGLLEPLCLRLSAEVESSGMTHLLRDIEQPLARVLCRMESEGFLVDRTGIERFGQELAEAMLTEQREIYLLAGGEFNVGSPKQLGEVLFTRLGLPASRKNKSGYSTDADTLEKLRGLHPIIEHIFAYRSAQKLNSTYVEGLLRAAGDDSRVHTEFRQTETRTGRISSVNPNLQNIPIRTELGSRMRKFFVAREGYTLLDADYSQIELRVLAHLSGDRRMTEAFLENRDIHTETAAEIFGLPRSMVSPELRRRAKAVNFGIVYGIGAYSLSQDVGVSVREASDYIESYLNTYSGVKSYLEKTIAEATEKGFVTTMFGRRRAIPELANHNKQVQSLGRRLAMNTPVQGSAADIIKLAMIRVEHRLREEQLDAKLILQVHDELIIECSEGCREAASRVLKEEMESAASLAAPLEVSVGEGKNWYDAK